MATQEKKCPSCGILKSYDEFYPSSVNKDSRSSYCRPCYLAYNRRIYKRDIEGQRERLRKKSALRLEREASTPPEILEKRRRRAAELVRVREVRDRKKIQEKQNQWRRSNRDKYSATQRRRRAAIYGAQINDLTAEQWVAIQEAYGHRCVYCGKKMKGKLTRDHIIPLSKNGNHTVSNVVPACRSCNCSKGNRNVKVPVQPLLIV